MADYLTPAHRSKVNAWNAAHPKRPAERVDVDAGGHPDQAPAELDIPPEVRAMYRVERLGARMDKAAIKREASLPADLIVAHRLELTKATDED